MGALGEISALLATQQLEIFGGFHPDVSEGLGATLLLLGPKEPGFWVHVTASPEFKDGAPNPLDRWSERVISGLAERLGAAPRFPFGGPPYQPFIAWALRTGLAWQSPAGPLVHHWAGMMVSYRGALVLPERVALPAPVASPCEDCAERPCLSACPVGALSAAQGYDLAACHGYLDIALDTGIDTGPACLNQGCAARRACPAGQGYARLPEQSAFHMRSFHPAPASSEAVGNT
jgi:hypothetical protein